MKEQQLSLDTFYSLVDEKVSENNKIFISWRESNT